MPELILILAIALIVIGPKKLPDLAKSLGRAMREFKKATSELKGSLELDSEMKEVKDAFDDIQSDIKDSVLEDKPRAGSDDSIDGKKADLEKDYTDWQKDPSPDPPDDGSAVSAAPSEIADAPTPPDSETTRPEDTPEKDR
ncbi:MAG: hypothetical protein AMJ54_09790 [Deltaproteobacteria bacterium SG8_13]|nr:MAG: hypothetical protein AMJ54_09790 [Deltaproteobacteria bacterium SG8_13]